MTDDAPSDVDRPDPKLKTVTRKPDDKRKAGESPAAGPHAKPELTNPESTPGSGLLPDPEDPSDAPDSASS